MYTAFLVGTAGSGKSLLTAKLSEYLQIYELNVTTLNMDPGVIRLPYAPDIDVREYINIDDIMTEFELGPNGGLVAAVDLITSQASLIREEINELSPDILLIDTPGQMELFAFRPTGVIAAKELAGDKCVLVNLLDTNLCRNAFGLINSLSLSMNVYMRFFYPQINVVSKIDLVEQDNLTQLEDWLNDSYLLEEAINAQVQGERRELAVMLLNILENMHLFTETLPISSKANINLDLLYGKLQQIWKGGEDFQVEDRVIR